MNTKFPNLCLKIFCFIRISYLYILKSTLTHSKSRQCEAVSAIDFNEQPSPIPIAPESHFIYQSKSSQDHSKDSSWMVFTNSMHINIRKKYENLTSPDRKQVCLNSEEFLFKLFP